MPSPGFHRGSEHVFISPAVRAGRSWVHYSLGGRDLLSTPFGVSDYPSPTRFGVGVPFTGLAFAEFTQLFLYAVTCVATRSSSRRGSGLTFSTFIEDWTMSSSGVSRRWALVSDYCWAHRLVSTPSRARYV
jgi:hypothetical protein